MAREALDAGNPTSAAQHAEASIRGNPRRSLGYLLLSEAYRRMGQKAKALAAAQHAYAIEQYDPAVVMGLAVVLDDNGINAESTRRFHQAIALDPTMPMSHLDFAIHLANIGQSAAALAELRTAAKLAPDDPGILVHVGDELADMGRSAEARAGIRIGPAPVARLRPGARRAAEPAGPCGATITAKFPHEPRLSPVAPPAPTPRPHRDSPGHGDRPGGRGPVCTGEFLSWDDSTYISGNPTLLPPTWHRAPSGGPTPDAGLWIPITYTAWGILALAAQIPGEHGPASTPSSSTPPT